MKIKQVILNFDERKRDFFFFLFNTSKYKYVKVLWREIKKIYFVRNSPYQMIFKRKNEDNLEGILSMISSRIIIIPV